MDSCDFGKKLNDTCHKLSYCRKIDLKKFDCYREDAREEFIWRSGKTDDKNFNNLPSSCKDFWYTL